MNTDDTPLAQLRRLAGEGDLEGTIGCNCYTCQLVRGGCTRTAYALLVALTDPDTMKRLQREVEAHTYYAINDDEGGVHGAGTAAAAILNLLATAALKGDADVG